MPRVSLLRTLNRQFDLNDLCLEARNSNGAVMREFYEVLDQLVALLQQRGTVTYRIQDLTLSSQALVNHLASPRGQSGARLLT